VAGACVALPPPQADRASEKTVSKTKTNESDLRISTPLECD